MFAAHGCTALLEAPDATFQASPIAFAHSLVPPEPQAGAVFGDLVSISGSALAVTAPYEFRDPSAQDASLTSDGTPNGEGATYLFDLSQPGRAPLRIIAPNADPGDGQIASSDARFTLPETLTMSGMCPALNDDWLVVGAAGEDGSRVPASADDSAVLADNAAPSAGAVYVYARSDVARGVGAPQYVKAPNVDAGDFFGLTVALSGSHLLVGAPGESSANPDDPSDNSAAASGAVYDFVERDGRFVFQQYIKAPPPIQHATLFGAALALQDDLLVIGAPNESRGGGSGSETIPIGDGAAYVYRLVDDRWSFEALLKPAVARSMSLFGVAVRVSGGRIAVGAPGAANCSNEPIGAEQRGALYVFAPGDRGWSIEQCLSPRTAHRGDLFGKSLAFAGDRLLVGAPWDASGRVDDPDDGSVPFAGAAYLEERSAAGWQSRQYIKAPQIRDNDVFGVAMALTPRLAIVSAWQGALGRDKGLSPKAGTLYVYDVSAPP